MRASIFMSVALLFGLATSALPQEAQSDALALVCYGDHITYNPRGEITDESSFQSTIQIKSNGSFYFKYDNVNGGFAGVVDRTNRSYNLRYDYKQEDLMSISFSMAIDRKTGVFSSQTISIFLRTGIIIDLRGNGTCAPDQFKPLF